MWKPEFTEIIRNRELAIYGICSTKSREKLLEEAIAMLQTDPDKAFEKQYLGMKNYAAFGDQRFDCEYGMGPSHGSIVFSIGRGKGYDKTKSELYVEFLIFVRDFQGIKLPGERNYDEHLYGIQGCINRLLDCQGQSDKIVQAITAEPAKRDKPER